MPGTYSVNDEGRVEAHLHATWDGSASFGFSAGPELPPLLHGESFGEHINLVGPRLGRSKGGMRSLGDITLHADYALEGFAFLSEHELAFTDLRLRFTDQDEWTGWDRFAVSHQIGSLTDVSASLRPVDELAAEVDGGVLRLVDASRVVYDPIKRRWELATRSMFELHLDEPLPIGAIFDRYAYPLQVALLSASGRLPGVASMAGTNTTWDFASGNTRVTPRWFQVRLFHGPLDTAHISNLTFLHRLGDLDFPTHLPRLLRVVEVHRFALSHYALLHAEHAAGGHLARFGVAVQMIEAFDRTLHPLDTGTVSLEARLKRLEHETGGLIDLVIGNRRWRGEVAQLRNFALHGDIHAVDVLRDQRPLVAASEALLMLFETRFLVEIGIQPDQAQKLVTGRVHHWTIVQAITSNYPALTAMLETERLRHGRKKGSGVNRTAASR
ncbi:hypothetical protein EBM89_08390 [Cellulomonas triticagri]|uniref:ApeA N-terminal domain-containing protein n=1 Tax=Cellulomonas triticagri TaxID=2483352 RepID=A0A3M2JQM8_9CELL|nr:hypothetical protein EBM89_08390 [Cellulomonas triticagri]